MSDINQEPPPVMMEGDEGHPYFEKIAWTHVVRPGIGIAFVSIIVRYLAGDEEDVTVRP
ncbi:hypothetical protein [Rhodohalobacter sp. 8-1]|uniref:hypothetical protein n=1 Tax=Rhodohalobacter sp. 8-1 TaxID=3131972 RepID=UPI0030EE0B36